MFEMFKVSIRKIIRVTINDKFQRNLKKEGNKMPCTNVIEIRECLNCENLALESLDENYICDLKNNFILEYIGKTKEEIEHNNNRRPCFKQINSNN